MYLPDSQRKTRNRNRTVLTASPPPPVNHLLIYLAADLGVDSNWERKTISLDIQAVLLLGLQSSNWIAWSFVRQEQSSSRMSTGLGHRVDQSRSLFKRRSSLSFNRMFVFV